MTGSKCSVVIVRTTDAVADLITQVALQLNVLIIIGLL